MNAEVDSQGFVDGKLAEVVPFPRFALNACLIQIAEVTAVLWLFGRCGMKSGELVGYLREKVLAKLPKENFKCRDKSVQTFYI